MKKTVLALATAVGLLIAMAPQSAEAALLLKLQEGANTAIITDVDNDGIINYSGSFGSFTTVLTFDFSGSPDNSILQATSIDIRNSTQGRSTLTITLGDTDYATVRPQLRLNSTGGGTATNTKAGDSVTFQSYVDPGNSDMVTNGLSSTMTALQSQVFDTFAGTTSFNLTPTSLLFASVGPFSMANVTTVSLSAGAQTNFSGTTDAAVPEPGSILLFGTGLFGLAGVVRRKFGLRNV